MTLTIELSEKDIKDILAQHIKHKLGDAQVDFNNVTLLVKSKQNYRAVWESAGVVVTTELEKYIPKGPEALPELKASVQLD